MPFWWRRVAFFCCCSVPVRSARVPSSVLPIFPWVMPQSRSKCRIFPTACTPSSCGTGLACLPVFDLVARHFQKLAALAPRGQPMHARRGRRFGELSRTTRNHGSVVYLAPVQVGPANPLYLEPSNHGATMVGIP